ncbi:MAG: hypothetical protein AB7H86_09095 [Blastocatellales bacterium]
MRFTLMMILVIVFFLFCLGVIEDPPNSGQTESNPAVDVPLETEGVIRSPYLPRFASGETGETDDTPRDIAYASGYWVRWAQRDLGIILRRGASGVYRFASGYGDANSRIRESENAEPENNSPPYPVQNNAPIPGMNRNEREIINEEVGDNENYENSPQKNR